MQGSVDEKGTRAPLVFVCYRQEDRPWLERLIHRFSDLFPNTAVRFWFDGCIVPGDSWQLSIHTAIERADLAVLLVTGDFLGSKYIVEHEVQKILRRRAAGGLDVVPVILRDCDWEAVSWLAFLQVTLAGRPVALDEPQAEADIDVIAKTLVNRLQLRGRLGEANRQPMSLGQILYDLLVGPERATTTFRELIEERAFGLGPVSPSLPPRLVTELERVLAAQPQPSAGDVFRLLELVDAYRREQDAITILAEAQAQQSEVERLQSEIQESRESAARLLRERPTDQSESSRWRAWDLEDRAQESEVLASALDAQIEAKLLTALQLAPSMVEIHEVLATRAWMEHRSATSGRRAPEQARAEARMQLHLEALPTDSPTRTSVVKYLRGIGIVTLVTDPPGAQVELLRFVERRRRLVLEPAGYLGPTPILGHEMEVGSYLAIFHCQGRHTVRYPFVVDREVPWHLIPPNGSEPQPIPLPQSGQFRSNEVFVPGGWFLVGGDEAEAHSPLGAQRAWCDSFVIQRDPVTVGEYVDFLNQNPPDLAERFAPRRIGLHQTTSTPFVLDRLGSRFLLSSDGHPVADGLPVTNIDLAGATAYLAWKASQDTKAWRLADELEWEKAARGVDGRVYPWGYHIDPSWACIFSSHESPSKPVPVNDSRFAQSDMSPYGVRGLGGNVRDWCAPIDSTHAVVRGGAWRYGGAPARSTSRTVHRVDERLAVVGFRGAFSPE